MRLIRQSKVIKSAREIQIGVDAKIKQNCIQGDFFILTRIFLWKFNRNWPTCKLVFIFDLAYQKSFHWWKMQRGGRVWQEHKT